MTAVAAADPALIEPVALFCLTPKAGVSAQKSLLTRKRPTPNVDIVVVMLDRKDAAAAKDKINTSAVIC